MSIWDRLRRSKAPPAAPAIKSITGNGGYNLPVSGGFIPAEWPWNFWQQGRDVMRGGDSPVVTACVDAYAQTLAALRGRHSRVNDKGGRDTITNSALARFMRAPNSYQTRSDFMLNLVKQLMYTGNSYAIGFRNDRNEIASTHIVNSRNAQVYIEPDTQAVFYGLGDNPMIGDLDMLVPARDVMHIRLYTPDNPLVGVSPIVNLAMSVSAGTAITRHQASFFSNMSRPSGIISTDQVLTREQMLQLRAAWEQQSQGLDSGNVPILSGGMKWQQLAINSQDSEVVKAYGMTVEDIARAFRVPLPLIGDNRYSTYNNVEQLVSAWLSMGLGFLLEHIELNFDHFFGLGPDDFTEFDVDTLLRTDFAGRIDALTKGISGGLYSPNEARRKEGLPEVDFGEEPRLQAQVVPLSRIDGDPAPSADPAPVDDDDTPGDLPAPSQEPATEEQNAMIGLMTKRLVSTRGGATP